MLTACSEHAAVLPLAKRDLGKPTVRAVWELRHNVTPQDACYVVTAGAYDVPLLTADLRLARAPKLGVRVIAVQAGARDPGQPP